MANNNAVHSTMARPGKTTYFVDVNKAKNGNKYIAISESRLEADDKKVSSTIRVFGNSIESFRQTIVEAATAATQ
jgi:Protein of unknown function (DUF3276)